MIASLVGGILGFVPEFFKILNDRRDKKHELDLLRLQIENAQALSKLRITEAEIRADISESQEIYKTYRTGVHWVDALNGTVRPVITYGFFFAYAMFKYLQYTMIGQGAPLYMYADVLWNTEDQAIFAGILSFYFGNRAMQKFRSK